MEILQVLLMEGIVIYIKNKSCTTTVVAQLFVYAASRRKTAS